VKPPSPVVVVLIAVLGSAGSGLYVISQAGSRLAVEVQERDAAEVEAARPPEPWNFWTVELENLSRELAEQREQLASRESELTRREEHLQKERAAIDATLRQVTGLKTQIDQTITGLQQQEMKNLKTLAETYALLTPAAAVAIFDQLDDSMVTKILYLMKPESSSAILQEISSGPLATESRLKRAAALSQRLRLLVPAKST
jgi:flagellar motility protein MotE (MotC chaperone)